MENMDTSAKINKIAGTVANTVQDVTDNDKDDQGVGLMRHLGREVNKETLDYLTEIKKADTIKFILGALAGQLTFVVYVILDFVKG